MPNKYIIAMIIFFSVGNEPAVSKPAGEIRIRVYDYVSVEARTLKKAEKEAARLLRAAGVRVKWLDCEILREDPPQNHPCAAPLTATDIHLRIYDRAMASRTPVRAGCVGVSLVADGFDSIGAVFYHRAMELKRQLGVPLAPILGTVIAHEVGHLLLDSTNHAKSGLMSAHWGDETLLRISRNQLGFAAPEKEKIALHLARRMASERRIESPDLTAGLFF